MQTSMIAAIYKNFLGHAPDWYKKTIIAFLIVNPFIFMVDPYIAGWTLVIQFIFTLAMALKCYRSHSNKEFNEVPASFIGNDEVLWFAHHGHYAA